RREDAGRRWRHVVVSQRRPPCGAAVRAAAARAPPPEPEGMSTGKKVALVAVPLVLLAVGAAVVLGNQGGSASTGPVKVVEVPRDPPAQNTQIAAGNTAGTQAESALITVSLDSTPSGASIYEGDEMIGTAPTKLQLRRDKTHAFSFRLPGHQDKELTLNLRRVAGDTQSANVTLEPVRAATPPRGPKATPKPAARPGRTSPCSSRSYWGHAEAPPCPLRVR
ncbi:PEGA domain-containing protein, partial [Myxococcus sp. 1LA]